MINHKNASLFIRSISVVVAMILVKLALHYFSIEFLTINNLFSGLVAANVFLMGFLLSGILSDYKESEKIPGEIAIHLSILYDEIGTLTSSDSELSEKIRARLKDFTNNIIDWFFRKIKTNAILAQPSHRLNKKA